MSDETKIKGMGSIPHAQGVAFRVWAPHAHRVSVIGSFNNWDGEKHPMQAEENGYWYGNKWLTRDVGAGGAGFGTQWDGMFVHPIRQAVITPHDADRSLAAVRDAICHRYNVDAFERVIFNSDWQGYNDDFSNHPGWDVLAVAGEYDGLPWHGTISIGPYSALIFSQ